MFKNIQNYLLLRHPLLWNVKLVPMLAVSVIINILFFVGGYINGAIDFTEYHSSHYDIDATIAFVTLFNVILSLLLLIIWLFFYLRNNAYKYFYPKSSTSLYKEWLLIFVICLSNCAYTVSFLYGTELRLKSYYPMAEVQKRTDILSKASMFAEGRYYLEADTVIKEKNVHRKFFKYKGRQYNYNSLLNKDVARFIFQSYSNDSLNRVTVQQWLSGNKKDSVYSIMQQFQALAAEHNLKSNITAQQWLDKVYNYPDFITYFVVGNNDFDAVYGYNNYFRVNDNDFEYEYEGRAREIDPKSNTITIIKGDTIIDPKYYVAGDQLEHAYGKLSAVWVVSPVSKEVLFILLYISIGLSMVVFSFRVTSGRDWLIALVSFGIMAIITGVISAAITGYFFDNMLLIDNEYFFFAVWVAIVVLLAGYYIYATKKLSKGISAIILNHILWLLPALLPVIAAIVFNVSEEFNEDTYRNGERIEIENPVYLFFKEYIMHIISANILIIVIYMYFLTLSIKRWKGIAEA